jgi:D-alanyl-lipoteichoic acid acyltransferase DltB (MBOAT superfamily)
VLFTEFSFIFIFLPITLAVYYWLPEGRQRLVAIIVASIVFYSAWNIYFLPMLLFAIISNYLIAVQLHKSGNKGWFYLGLVVALTPIVYFKYSGLFIHTAGIDIDTGFFGEKLGSLLPLGISFYTFQQITYLTDVYGRRNEPGRFVDYAFFKLFFPQLIAGPILHYNQLVPQIGQPVDRERLFAEGTVYFLIGFIKKFFLADGFAAYSDPIYDGTDPVTTQMALIATLGYTFQLYFDFSGYSDMALGLARMFGFLLPWNFDSPYKARSISDFWRRWHMTLSRFLRDYVYIPLGGNRYGEISRYRNLILTMLIGGLWHGAAWTFVLWGGLHGLGLAINHLWNRFVGIRLFGLGWVLTFIMVALLWVLFRATSFERAMDIYRGLIAFEPLDGDRFWWWALAGAAITFLMPNSHRIVEFVSERMRLPAGFSITRLAPRLGVYAALSSLVLYGAAYAYYTTDLDRVAYRHLTAPQYASGMDNRSGDFRNNLWSKQLFAEDETRIMLAGSSFTSDTGNFQLLRDEQRIAVSDTFGMGGNGIMNGLRAIASVANERQADIFIVGISPLNFGITVKSMPFPGECLDVVEPEFAANGYEFPVRPLGACNALPSQPSSYLSVLDANRNGGVFQFKNFIRNIALSPTQNPLLLKSLQLNGLPGRLDDIVVKFDRMRQSQVLIRNTENGSDQRFNWRSRKIIESLSKDEISYDALKILKEIVRKSGGVLVAYETPTVAHSDAPHIYPEGFFEEYQSRMTVVLAELGIPYLDLSRILPWNGAAMRDFIHPELSIRPLIHEILLAWIFDPEALRQAGIVDPAKVPDIPGIEEVLR